MHPAHQQYQPVVLQRPPIAPVRPDLIAIVGFGNRASVLAAPATAAAPTITQVIQNVIPSQSDGLGGGTNIAAGLRVAGSLLRNAPKGFRRRAWLLSDGMPNCEENEIFPQLQLLTSQYVNVNTIAFGNDADVKLLQRIAAATHNGRYFQVNDLAALTRAFVGSQPHHHSIATKPELTVYVIDKSGSMWDPMGTSKKIDIVQQALLNLVHYKKQLFS
jgi:Mg-chelatase subunit ChlD